MTDGVAYLEASAIVKLIRREPETDRLLDDLRRRDRLVTSRLSIVEVGRVAVREGVPRADVAPVFEAFVLADITPAIVRLAADLAPPALRTLDAIHVATALALADELAAFIAYDRRLIGAAAFLGLPVTAP